MARKARKAALKRPAKAKAHVRANKCGRSNPPTPSTRSAPSTPLPQFMSHADIWASMTPQGPQGQNVFKRPAKAGVSYSANSKRGRSNPPTPSSRSAPSTPPAFYSPSMGGSDMSIFKCMLDDAEARATRAEQKAGRAIAKAEKRVEDVEAELATVRCELDTMRQRAARAEGAHAAVESMPAMMTHLLAQLGIKCTSMSTGVSAQTLVKQECIKDGAALVTPRGVQSLHSRATASSEESQLQDRIQGSDPPVP